MKTFLCCLAFLIVGYFTYGKFIDKLVGPNDSNETPATRLRDGVDYVPMPWYKVFLVQFLNIAGTGPIFGAVLGAMFGPVAFLWITLGCVFAGAVHDYFSGIISIRHDGASVSELVGIYLGPVMKNIMRVFSVVLLLLVGTVFVSSPAALLSTMTGKSLLVWTIVIIAYYILATVLPVDKVIGKIYPLFGAALLIMAVGLCGGMFYNHFNGTMPMMELTLKNLNPKGLSVFPFLFTTIACGALSGFHATQSPMMARCVNRESESRRVFYGAMIVEGIVALIWCAVAIAFFGNTLNLSAALDAQGTSGVVTTISKGLLGTFGAILAVLGVVACPITSGDTAFRSARLTIADAFKLKQDKILNRFLIAIPLFLACIYLTTIDFNIIWRYFAWSNQTLATIFLWTATAFLIKNKKCRYVTMIPAIFMTYICVTYILQAPEGFKIAANISNIISVIATVIITASFVFVFRKKKQEA